MPRTSKEITTDAQQLKKLMPSYADTPQVLASARHAEKHGDKKALIKDRRIGAHLLRLEKLLSHDGVESRVWDSAVKELIIKEENVPEAYWQQQLQQLRDNGYGEVTRILPDTKKAIVEQLQDAQRTGLESWRTYLEQTGDQYPLWFKLYAWEGMSGLGVFDQQKQRFRKRSKDTVAPYPQLNPAVLAKAYDIVTDSQKTEPFNALYSRLLVEQKASMPTPENPEDVHGEWREYTSSDIEAITEAAQATPWCIAGKSYARSYTQDGGKFLLFHLQDIETGVFSPTACASIRLDGNGNVVELSGLKGGSSQYLEDGLIPTVEDKVKTLPGGERYLQAFEDKQKLIAMDKKFQAGEPFTEEELLFLYEVNRPIRYIDTYAHDPRPDQFKQDRPRHLAQLAEMYGGNEANAWLILDPITDDYQAPGRIRKALEDGVGPEFLLNRLDPIVRLKNLEMLTELGVKVDVNELAAQIPRDSLLGYFTLLQEYGLTLTIEEFAERYSDKEKITYFEELKKHGLRLTADELAARFDDSAKLINLGDLKRIGATFDVDELIVRKYGEGEILGLKGATPEVTIGGMLRAGASPELILKMLKMAESQEEELYGKGGVYASGAVYVLQDIIHAVPNSGIDQEHFIHLFYKKLRDNNKTFVGNYGGGTHKFVYDFLKYGFDVNTVARVVGVDAGSKMSFDGGRIGGNMFEFMKRGVEHAALLEGLQRFGNSTDTYGISQNIAELVEYGCDIKDITEHIAPKYQFDQFDTLQEFGAKLNINTVVESMDPGDVISKIAKIRERGIEVDINEILQKAREGDVYEFMVPSLMAAGADPVLVAKKIPTRPYVSEYGHMRDSEWRRLESLKAEAPEVYESFLARLNEAIKEGRLAREEAYRKAREREKAEKNAARS